MMISEPNLGGRGQRASPPRQRSRHSLLGTKQQKVHPASVWTGAGFIAGQQQDQNINGVLDGSDRGTSIWLQEATGPEQGRELTPETLLLHEELSPCASQDGWECRERGQSVWTSAFVVGGA